MTELNTGANGDAIKVASPNGANGEPRPLAILAIDDHPLGATAGGAPIVVPVASQNSSPEVKPNPQPASSQSDLNAAGRPTLPGSRPEFCVADIRKNQPDCRGEKIDFVFYRRRDYAIYRSGGKILIHYSDDDGVAKTQIANTAELLPLRGRLQYLLKDMETPHAHHWQIAESLRLGLDGQKDAAKSTIQAAIDNILARRVSEGRTTYLVYAGAVVIGALAMLCATAGGIWWFRPEVVTVLKHLMMATGSGAMGAMLSTAIALRARTVATDVDLKSNAVDSAVRIMIGIISAAVLYLFLDSNILDNLQIAGLVPKPVIDWKVALLVGFAAGFLERLVPDLLEKKLAVATK
jgi:hypothetical protein